MDESRTAPVDRRRRGLRRHLVGILYKRQVRGYRRLAATIAIPKGEFITPVEGGLELLLDPTANPTIDRELYLYGSYEPGTIALMSALIEPGDCVLDIGANLGLMSCHAAKFVGDEGLVIAVEPSRPSFRRLQINVAINQLANVRLVNMGASSEPGVADLFYRPVVGSGGTTMMRDGAVDADERVPVATVDSILASEAHPPIRFLKLDIEGFEYDALVGSRGLLTGSDAPIVCMEYSVRQANTARTSAERIIHDLGAIAFRTEVGKSRPDFGALVELREPDDYPEHDNVYFVPDSRVEEVARKITVRWAV